MKLKRNSALISLLLITGVGAASAESIKVGFIEPISGKIAVIGIAGRNSAELTIQLRHADPASKHEYEPVAPDDTTVDGTGHREVFAKFAAGSDVDPQPAFTVGCDLEAKALCIRKGFKVFEATPEHFASRREKLRPIEADLNKQLLIGPNFAVRVEAAMHSTWSFSTADMGSSSSRTGWMNRATAHSSFRSLFTTPSYRLRLVSCSCTTCGGLINIASNSRRTP